MSTARRLALVAALSILFSPFALAADAAELRAEFEGIIQGLNRNSFDKFNRAIDNKDLTARIYAGRIVEPAVKAAFSKEFSTSIEQMFTSSFPPSKKEILGTVVDFRTDGVEGRAVVRYVGSGYRFVYHVYEFRADPKGRLAIVDWVNYYQGGRFSDDAGEALVRALPSKQATRNMLSEKTVDEGQVFQVGELFKAARDSKPERFFQIYDGLDETLRAEKVIVRLNWHLALKLRDDARIEDAAARLNSAFPDDPLQSLRLAEYYIATRQFEEAIAAIDLLQRGLGVSDGATESLKASAAMALGNYDDAGKYAQQATQSEPSLELSWWSLLRARTAAGDYGGATEAMAKLEDDFGESLDPAQLGRDRFLRVLLDKQEYLDWRASRD